MKLQKPDSALVSKKVQQAIEKMESDHLIYWRNSIDKVIFISNQYPGLWLEHTYDAVAWANFRPEDTNISKAQVKLFLDNQTQEGQLPCLIWKDLISYGWLQECVSFTAVALEACKQSNDIAFLNECYEKCQKWDEWLVQR